MVFVNDIIPFLISLTMMFFISSLVMYGALRNVAYALIIPLVRYLFCLIYFVVWSKYSPIILLDDQTYFQESKVIFETANGSISYLFSYNSIEYIASLAGGTHFGYYIYNFLSFVLFGQYYYSPVLLNVFFSILTSILLYRTLIRAGVNKSFCMFFLLFFSLHWDVLSWSSFINLKDILVSFFTVWALNCLIRFRAGERFFPIASFILICFVLLFFRFYLVYFLCLTAFIYLIFMKINKFNFSWKGTILKIGVLIIMPVVFYVALIKLFAKSLADIGGTTNVLIGFIRFLLTPFPLTIEPDYSFLLFSALLHWLCLPLLFYGLYLFVKRYFFSLLPFLILTLLLCVFYGSFAELQGPRHRVLISFFITLLQALSIFEVIKLFTKSNVKKCAESSEQL